MEMVRPESGDGDRFRIVIRRQRSDAADKEEIVETIDGVDDGTMCRYCCYVAKLPAQLTQHTKIHTGQRDYHCSVAQDGCRYKTLWRCDMKKHLRKFHADVVERHAGNYYDLLQTCYRPTQLADDSAAAAAVDACSVGGANVFKLSKRHRRRLQNLRNKEDAVPPGSAAAKQDALPDAARSCCFMFS